MFRRGREIDVKGFTDADYARSITDTRSTIEYCVFLGGNLMSWRSKKQSIVARSSAELEFRTMALGICELLWLKIILDDLKIKTKGAIRLSCDNKSAISIAHNPVQHNRTKHIEIDRYFIKEKMDAGLVHIPHVSSEDQVADVFTKGLAAKRFEDLICNLGMVDIYSLN